MMVNCMPVIFLHLGLTLSLCFLPICLPVKKQPKYVHAVHLYSKVFSQVGNLVFQYFIADHIWHLVMAIDTQLKLLSIECAITQSHKINVNQPKQH